MSDFNNLIALHPLNIELHFCKWYIRVRAYNSIQFYGHLARELFYPNDNNNHFQCLFVSWMIRASPSLFSIWILDFGCCAHGACANVANGIESGNNLKK